MSVENGNKPEPTEADLRRRKRDDHITAFLRLRAINMLEGAAIIASDDASRTSRAEFLEMAGRAYDRYIVKASFMREKISLENNPPDCSGVGIMPPADPDLSDLPDLSDMTPCMRCGDPHHGAAQCPTNTPEK